MGSRTELIETVSAEAALAMIIGLKTERTIESDINILKYFNTMFC